MIYVTNRWSPSPCPGAVEVDTTSRGKFTDLSPFYLGPITDPLTGKVCLKMENYWQFSKVYEEHVYNNIIMTRYWDWRATGFSNYKAIRYPMGKGKKPIGSISPTGQVIGYIDARKQLYIPAYSELVKYTKSYALLYKWAHEEGRDIVLRDFDGYDYIAIGMSLKDVVNNPKKLLGHAFVIAGMLTGQLNFMME